MRPFFFAKKGRLIEDYLRAAEVRTKSGTYVRPTAKLCLLEEFSKQSE